MDDQFKKQIEEDLKYYDYQMAIKNTQHYINKDSNPNLRNFNSSDNKKTILSENRTRNTIKRSNTNNNSKTNRFVQKLRKEFDQIRSIEDEKNFKIYPHVELSPKT